jgi:hypothetical protein
LLRPPWGEPATFPGTQDASGQPDTDDLCTHDPLSMAIIESPAPRDLTRER